jgi:DNA-directed RNA polymerase subunit RPC12/RpoP
MTRFPCPQCGKVLQVSGEQVGRPVTCPRCGEPSVAPAPAAAERDEAGRPPPTQQSEPARGLFRGMSSKVRWAVALVAGAGAVTLVLAALSPLLPAPRGVARAAADWAVPLAACSIVLLLAILYGHATGCPACGRWWSRAEVERGYLGREVFDKGGVSFGRSQSRTTYQCGGCGHRWSVTDTEEYREPARVRRQRHRG